MNNYNTKEFFIQNELDVARIVLEAGKLAQALGFNRNIQVSISTIVSELGKNILYHAGKGSITLNKIEKYGKEGIEIYAQDNGPGIKNVDIALKEHFSTRKTLGLGLGAVKRMADELSIESKVGEGTIVIARKWLHHG